MWSLSTWCTTSDGVSWACLDAIHSTQPGLDRDGRYQIVFYQSGVGSETDFAGNALPEAILISTYVFMSIIAPADMIYRGSRDSGRSVLYAFVLMGIRMLGLC